MPCSISSQEEKNSIANEWESVVKTEERTERRFFTASVKAAMRNGSVESK